jgi:hypothetical protein
VLDVSDLVDPGFHNVPVKIVAPDVAIRSLSPASVTLSLDRLEERVVPVSVDYVGGRLARRRYAGRDAVDDDDPRRRYRFVAGRPACASRSRSPRNRSSSTAMMRPTPSADEHGEEIAKRPGVAEPRPRARATSPRPRRRRGERGQVLRHRRRPRRRQRRLDPRAGLRGRPRRRGRDRARSAARQTDRRRARHAPLGADARRRDDRRDHVDRPQRGAARASSRRRRRRDHRRDRSRGGRDDLGLAQPDRRQRDQVLRCRRVQAVRRGRRRHRRAARRRSGRTAAAPRGPTSASSRARAG